jgi:hypothetical protein
MTVGSEPPSDLSYGRGLGPPNPQPQKNEKREAEARSSDRNGHWHEHCLGERSDAGSRNPESEERGPDCDRQCSERGQETLKCNRRLAGADLVEPSGSDAAEVEEQERKERKADPRGGVHPRNLGKPTGPRHRNPRGELLGPQFGERLKHALLLATALREGGESSANPRTKVQQRSEHLSVLAAPQGQDTTRRYST